jgi:hypothetical protein
VSDLPGGVTPSTLGYLGRKIPVIINLQGIIACKIQIANGLRISVQPAPQPHRCGAIQGHCRASARPYAELTGRLAPAA